MRFLLIIACIFAVVRASDVVVLTDKNFQETVKKSDLILVKFYAPWCGHCKRLAPEYDKAAKELSLVNPPVPIAKLDCTENQEACNMHGVSGYPTLKVFRRGQASDYKGPRTSAGIVKYMQGLVGPAAIEITTVEEAERYVPKPTGDDMRKTVVFGFFKTHDSDMERFLEVAEEWRGKFTFLVTSREDVLRHYRMRHTFVVYRPHGSLMKWADDEAVSRSGMKAFVARHGIAPGAELTEDNKDVFQARDQPILTVLTSVNWKSNEKTLNYLTKRLTKLANIHSNVAFALADAEKHKQLVDRLGFTASDVKNNAAVALQDLTRDKRWKFSGVFSVDAATKFIKSVDAGDIPAFIKSEAAPADNPKAGEGKVITVTANTFDSIVRDSTKNVLLEMYAPWCGHCKKLEPIYNELAKAYTGDDSVVIAKMDATANDQPAGFSVTGFPTLFWIPKNSKATPATYSGERTVDAFKKYIQKNRA